MTAEEVFKRVQEIQSVIRTRAIEKHYAEGGDSVLEFLSRVKWRPNYIEVYLEYDKQFVDNGHEETSVYIDSEEVDLNEEERNLMGIASKPELDLLIQKAYTILNLISFFTTGKDETRAWTITRGTKAPQAAGVIHGDFEKYFIRADVIS